MKNKPFYRIITPYGEVYQTDDKGYVVKYSNGLDKTEASLHDLMTWQITGIREIRPFGNLGCLIRLDEASELKSFSFKNRRPKYVICDIDHGTSRIHGNSLYHGVRTIEKIN
jgi:hypothetical protein